MHLYAKEKLFQNIDFDSIHFNIIEIRENPFLQSVNIELYSWNDFGRSNLKNKHKS